MIDISNNGSRDFDAWRKERMGEPIRFRLGGVDFEIPRKLSSLGFFDFVDQLKAIRSMDVDLNDPGVNLDFQKRNNNLSWSFLENMLPRSVYEKLVAVCKENAIDGETIQELVNYIQEAATGRPTVVPSASVLSSSTIGQPSKDDSSSEVSESATSG